jgi:polyisoprenoid-binding protein YceI
MACALVAGAVLAGSLSHAAGEALEATCEIAFSGSSGLGPWTGRIAPLRIRPTPSATSGRWNAVIEIPIASLEDGNKPRDIQLHAMFESRRWPTLRVDLRDVDPVAMKNTSRLPVELTIRDQKRTLEATLTRWRAEGARSEFEADVAVSLEAFSLEAPSVLGLSKVSDEVKIRARVVVAPAGAAKQ